MGLSIKITTIVVICVTVIFFIGSICLPHDRIGLLIVGVILLLVSIGCYLRVPIQYEMGSDNDLVIRFRCGKKVFPEIKTVTQNNSLPAKAIRLLGNAGLFGVTGIYWNKGIGKFYVYATDLKDLTLIELKNGAKVFISPE